RAFARPESLHLLSGIHLGSVHFPTQTVVQSQVRLNLPAVLRKQVNRLATHQFMIGRALGHAIGQTEQIVGIHTIRAHVVSAKRRATLRLWLRWRWAEA